MNEINYIDYTKSINLEFFNTKEEGSFDVKLEKSRNSGSFDTFTVKLKTDSIVGVIGHDNDIFIMIPLAQYTRELESVITQALEYAKIFHDSYTETMFSDESISVMISNANGNLADYITNADFDDDLTCKTSTVIVHIGIVSPFFKFIPDDAMRRIVNYTMLITMFYIYSYITGLFGKTRSISTIDSDKPGDSNEFVISPNGRAFFTINDIERMCFPEGL